MKHMTGNQIKSMICKTLGIKSSAIRCSVGTSIDIRVVDPALDADDVRRCIEHLSTYKKDCLDDSWAGTLVIVQRSN